MNIEVHQHQESFKSLVQINFRHRWAYIASVRAFFANFLQEALSNEAQAEEITIAIHELLENALKYSDDDQFSIAIDLEHKNQSLVVHVKNRTSQQQVAILEEILSFLASEDKDQVFKKMVQRSIKKGVNVSQLGLARVHCSAQGKLEIDFSENGVLTLSARFPISQDKTLQEF